MSKTLDPSNPYHSKLRMASYNAISNRERLAILLLIYNEGPLSVSEIGEIMGYGKDIIYQHLAVLKNTRIGALDESSGKWIQEDMPLIEEDRVYRTTRYGKDVVEIIIGIDKEKR